MVKILKENFEYVFIVGTLVKSGVECKSEDNYLGDFDTVGECSNACREKSGCNFFIYGTGGKAGKCYWEKTKNRECPEGWESHQYDFHEIPITSKLGKIILI